MGKSVLSNLEDTVKEVEHYTEGANLALTEMRLQFDTLSEIQKEERIEYQKMHNESIKEIMDRHEKDIKHWKHICISILLLFALFIGSLIGGTIYFLSNYDIAFGYTQDLYIGNNGENTINDGIHYNFGADSAAN